MIFWIDTEFNDYRGALISMALVADDGSEWYEVLNCDNPSKWVMNNVMPHLNKEPVSIGRMKVSLSTFLLNYENITIIADWPDDIRHFCDLMITGPGLSLPLLPIDFRILEISGQSALPHNALEDAKANRQAYYENKA